MNARMIIMEILKNAIQITTARKVLFDDLIADMFSNRKSHEIVTTFFVLLVVKT